MVKCKAICDFVGMKSEGSYIKEGTILHLPEKRFEELKGFGYVKTVSSVYSEKVENIKRETKELKYDNKRSK